MDLRIYRNIIWPALLDTHMFENKRFSLKPKEILLSINLRYECEDQLLKYIC